MGLPLSLLTDAVVQQFNENAVTIWHSPKNPSLSKLYSDSVALGGFTTDFKMLPISSDVVQVPIAANYASPRATLPIIDGNQQVLRYVLPYELQVPLQSPTIDEWETRMMSLMLFGKSRQSFKDFSAEKMAIRLKLGIEACRNRWEVIVADLYRTCSLITDGTYSQKVSNTFVRKEATEVAHLETPYYGYADLTAGNLIGLRWVNADQTLNTSAEPVQDVNNMAATLAYYGGGNVYYFVATNKAMQAYALDFKTNYKDLSDKTFLTTATAAIQIPTHLAEIGWAVIGYFYIESENWRPVPVFGGANIQYRDWDDGATNKTLLPSSEHFVFPVATTKVFEQRWTHVDNEAMADYTSILPVNLYQDNRTKSIQGEILHRGYIYPRINPNAIVYRKV